MFCIGFWQYCLSLHSWYFPSRAFGARPGDWCLYTVQWFLTMFYAVVWGFAIVGVGLEFTGSTMTAYIAAVVLTVGVSTPAIGPRTPSNSRKSQHGCVTA